MSARVRQDDGVSSFALLSALFLLVLAFGAALLVVGIMTIRHNRRAPSPGQPARSSVAGVVVTALGAVTVLGAVGLAAVLRLVAMNAA